MRRQSAAIITIKLALGGIASAGCVPIAGGAIEASWVLRTDDGRAISRCGCGDPVVARVRINAFKVTNDVLGADECARNPGCEFSCDSQRGATPFFLQPGRYAVAVTPVGADGVEIGNGGGMGKVRLQAPILREVVEGQPTQLEAFLIVVPCHGECGGDKPGRSCSRD